MKRELAQDLMRWMGVVAFAGVLGLWAVQAAIGGGAPRAETVSADMQPSLEEVLHASGQAAAEEGFCVVVDAGHGGKDGGTIGVGGAVEAPLNLAVAKLVQAELEKKDVKVIMTRTDEDALGNTKDKDMAARREIIRTEGVDAVVSIHMNNFSDPSISGPMVFYMKGAEQGKLLATELINALCDALGRSRRLANPGDYYMVRECEAAAAIVECGFLSNAEDEQKLQQREYQQTLAKAVADGVVAFLSGSVPD